MCTEHPIDKEEQTMTPKELEAKVAARQEWKRIAEDAQTMLTSIEDEIKADMTAQNLTSVTAGAFRVSWQYRSRTSIDGTALTTALPAVAAQFTKTTSYRVFQVR
jgi:predicted phage-related endonuclease